MSIPTIHTIFARKRTLIFTLLSIALIALYYATLKRLLQFALSEDGWSHILLIPLVSGWFFFRSRKAIFGKIHYSLLAGAIILALGLVLHFAALPVRDSPAAADYLSLATASLLVSFIGTFVLCFGTGAFKEALFPLLFSAFMIPLPSMVERAVVELFRFGSTEMVNVYFRVAHIPFIREGSTFHLEHLSFRVANQCSGINSGLSLFIVSIIAAKLYLLKPWSRLFFILSVLPIGWIKNGLRIATLTLLGSYVNPDYLHGPLHRQGGRPFFVLALLFLGLSLFLCRYIEKRVKEKQGKRHEARGTS